MIPTFDSDGYPTAKTLWTIREWPADDPSGWLGYAREAWKYSDHVSTDGYEWTFATGGWSGNEDLITYMGRNTILWHMCFESSYRGGKYVFRLPAPEAAT